VGDVEQQHADVGGRTVRAAPQRIECIRNRQAGNVPLLGTRVIAVQVEPQAGRHLAAGAMMLDDRHPGVVDAPVQDQGQFRLVALVIFRGEQLSTVRVGVRNLSPGGDHLMKGFLLGIAERQRAIGETFGQLVFDETERDSRLLQQLQVDFGRRRGLQQAVEELRDLTLRLFGVGQRQAGKDSVAGIQVRNSHRKHALR